MSHNLRNAGLSAKYSDWLGLAAAAPASAATTRVRFDRFLESK